MEDYQKEFALLLAESGALFFAPNLRLKDGRPTPYFINMGLFRTGRLSSLLGALLARLLLNQGWSEPGLVIVGPSYKGSALAVATAQALWTNHHIDLAFEYDRKEAKTHGEATGGRHLFVTGALYPQARIVIVDDVGTSMSTKYELLHLLKTESEARNLDLNPIGVVLAVDRQQTTAVYDEEGRVREGIKGEDALARFSRETGIPIRSLAGIREVVAYLAAEKIPLRINGVRQPFDQATLSAFEEYIDTYGVDPRRSASGPLSHER